MDLAFHFARSELGGRSLTTLHCLRSGKLQFLMKNSDQVPRENQDNLHDDSPIPRIPSPLIAFTFSSHHLNPVAETATQITINIDFWGRAAISDAAIMYPENGVVREG
jgi:hypothetical protein